MKTGILGVAVLSVVVAPQGLSAQTMLSHQGSESTVLSPATAAHAARVREFQEHRRMVDAPEQDDLLSVVEMFFARIGRVELAAGCVPLDSIIPVDPGDWPRDTAAQFRILADASGEVYAVEEEDVGCDGNERITYRHYFRDGLTVAFERESRAATSCGGQAVTEVTTYYYGDGQELIAKEYSLTDAEGRSYRPEECGGVTSREPYSIAASYRDLLRTRLRGMTVVPG